MAETEKEFQLTDPDSVDRLRFQMESYVFGRSIVGYEADRRGMELHLSDGGAIRFELREQAEKPGVDVILFAPLKEPETATETVQ